MNLTIRPIQREDNKQIAKVIRGALEDFGANKPGTVYFDPTTDDLYTLFQTSNSIYYIAEIDGNIVGGVWLISNIESAQWICRACENLCRQKRKRNWCRKSIDAYLF